MVGLARLVPADPAVPRAKQIDAELGNLSGFVTGETAVQVRENDAGGARLKLRDIGVRTAQVPFADIAYWFSERSSIEGQFRYFAVTGTHFLDAPSDFNGATIAGGQSVRINPVWYSVGLFYQRRWTPAWLREGDLRGLFGFRYTFLDFRINGGHAPVTPTSLGKETKEDFYLQELPIPTAGLRFSQRLSRLVIVEASVVAGWLDNVNTGQKEGGSVYLSQRETEMHLQARLADSGRFELFHPMIGLFYLNFRQREESREDGNFIQFSALGPEVGLQAEFGR